MQLQQRHREQIRTRVGGSDQDVTVACNVIEVFSKRMRAVSGVSSSKDMVPVSCDIDTNVGDGHFFMNFTSGCAMFSHGFGVSLDQVSPQIVDVRLLMSERVVRIVVARSTSITDKQRHVPPTTDRKRRRHHEIDFAASHVVDADDQEAIGSIADAVYQAFDRVPASMIFWFEPVRGDVAAHLPASRGGAPVPLSDELADESVSESMQGGDVVGFTLCFSGTPDLSHAFLHWLYQMYPTRIASLYAWLHVPNTVNQDAMLVINVRRAAASISDAQRTVQNSQPRGIRHTVRVKRARA